MLKSYTYRLYPNEKQRQHLIQSMGCARYIYNTALEAKVKHYEQTSKTLSFFELCKLLPEQKKEHEWLKAPLAQCLQMSLRNLDNAFTAFFRKQNRFPKFKSKHNEKQTIQYPQRVRVNWNTSKVYVPKCGDVSAVLDRNFEGAIKTCTISKVPSGKFYISILVENGIPLPEKKPISEDAIGIDVGIRHFVILSNGEKIENPKHLEQSLLKLKKLQRRLSRKTKGSNNRNKAKLKVARIHEKIANQREDFLHQLSTRIIRENQTIILEDLDIKSLLQKAHSNLARNISSSGWYTFGQFLSYKAEWQGKNVVKIGQFEPSSKMCSTCGQINHELTLSDRRWECNGCHTIHDRDTNASINIKKFGLIQSKAGQELPVEPIEMPSLDGSQK